MKDLRELEQEWDQAEKREELIICQDCDHFVSMHGDNGECYSCPKNICKQLA